VTAREDAVFDWFHLGSSDTEAPQTSHALDPGAPDGDGGWYVSPVEVSLEASDGDGSGVARTEYRIGGGEWRTYDAPFAVGDDGEHTVQYRSIDEEGNEEQARSATFKIDRTAPVVACSATPKELWPPNHGMKPVTAAVTVTDATSGPGGYALGAATSSEADAGLDPDDVPGDLAGWEVGTADAGGEVRAERAEAGQGRTYSLRYEGRDTAGNTADCTATVRVPKSRGDGG
jgi:sialidase-1